MNNGFNCIIIIIIISIVGVELYTLNEYPFAIIINAFEFPIHIFSLMVINVQGFFFFFLARS